MNQTLLLLLSPNPKILLLRRHNFRITSPTCKSIFNNTSSSSSSSSSSSIPRIVAVKCCSNSAGEQNGTSNLKNAVSGMVGEQVEELLKREENKVLLDELDKATQRVELAKIELAEIEKQEIETRQKKDYIKQLEMRASEIEECQREISEAKAMIDEAERTLSLDDGNAFIEGGSEEIEIVKDAERLESVKAALISAVVGTIAGLPISFTQVTTTSELILPVAITFISCALFGVTFRYTIRRDLDNVQLKNGTSAAFGVVKGLATMGGGPPLALDAGSLLSHAFDGAVYVSESVLIFVFAAVSLDFCFKMRILSPFPIKKSVSRTNLR